MGLVVQHLQGIPDCRALLQYLENFPACSQVEVLMDLDVNIFLSLLVTCSSDAVGGGLLGTSARRF